MQNLANLFKALSDETRLKILYLLSEGELCVCELIDELQMSQPAVSHHMKILKQAQLINDRREGRWIYYKIDQTQFNAYQQLLAETFFLSIQGNLKKAKTSVRTRCL